MADPEEHGERMLFGSGIFAGEEYADVRWMVLLNDKCPAELSKKFQSSLKEKGKILFGNKLPYVELFTKFQKNT